MLPPGLVKVKMHCVFGGNINRITYFSINQKDCTEYFTIRPLHMFYVGAKRGLAISLHGPLERQYHMMKNSQFYILSGSEV